MADGRAGGLVGLGDWILARGKGQVFLLLFGLGGLAALALPPHDLFFFGLPGFAALGLLLHQAVDADRPLRRAFIVTFSFLFGYHVVGLAWISQALLYDPEQFAWMIPFAIGGLSAIMAVIGALAGPLAVLPFLGRKGVSIPWLACTLAAAWICVEWLRGHLFTGFPWNPVGSVWSDVPALLQGGSLIGVYGMTGLTVLAATAFGTFLRTMRPVPALLPSMPLVLIGLWGLFRLDSAEISFVDGVVLRLVQPNIPQAQKWDPTHMPANLAKQIALSRRAAAGFGGPGEAALGPATHAIWGETMVPYDVAGLAAAREALAQAVPSDGGLVIVGAPRRQQMVAPDGTSRVHAFNSLFAVDRQGEIRGQYDKAHLVPFGEYVPLAGVLDRLGLNPVVGTGFSPGPGLATLNLPGLPPVSPLICYEVIFPGRVLADDQPRPDWILNLTNDAWYGTSAGPYQHMATARWRAVEEGLPLVRVANTGISGILDPWGRDVVRLDLVTEGWINGPLPRSLSPTFFALWGNISAICLSILLGGFGLLGRRNSAYKP
ncbi:MAG: apolipoprotein N-acyltransferase [Magnetovibrionaceae bacterium]